MAFAVCLLIAGSSFAQARTREEVDSLKALYLKSLKALPPADPNLVKYRSQVHVSDVLHYSKVRAYEVQAVPAIFETAFFKDAVDIGEISIETGKIVACDPIGMRDAKPFLQTFPVGNFPVQLAIARINGGTVGDGGSGLKEDAAGKGGGVNDEERVAFSRIYFSDKPVVRWEFALDSGDRQLPVGGDTLYGYGVDGGLGVFIDAQANDAFSELRKLDDNLWNAVFTGEVGKHDHITWQYALFEFQRHNLACFSTGVGDGFYGTYVGYDKEGRICRLLTDFGLVRWWKK